MEILERFYTRGKLFIRKFLLMSVLLCICVFSSVEGAPLRLQEQKIKAGLLYSFIKYSYWPESAFQSPDQPFQICILGGDAFNGALDSMQGRTAQLRPINIRKINRPERVSYCHVAFISRSQEENLPEILAAAKGQHVLLISDIQMFSYKGGMVEFSNPTEKRIELYLNTHNIEEAGLRVGDQLLKLAKVR